MAYCNPKSASSKKEIDDLVKTILKIVCSHPGCQIKLSDLKLELRRSGNIISHDIVTLLDDYSNNFLVNDNTVTAFTGLEICPEHCKRNDYCSEVGCDQLHICKFFLLSQCRFNQNEIPCKFGHSLDSEHNKALLERNFIDHLTTPEIQRLFQSGNSRSSTTMPLVCRFYNHQRGCTKYRNCPHLHICQFYIDGSCKFGPACKRNHNLNRPEVERILRNFGIDINRRPRDIINDLRMSLPRYSQNQQTLRKFTSMPVLGNLNGVNLMSPQTRFKPTRQKRMSEGPGASNEISVSKTDEICMYNLRGSNGCWFPSGCHGFHKLRTYQWQYMDSDWPDFDDFEDFVNKKLEANFRDVACSECTVCLDTESDSDDDNDSEDESDDGESEEEKGSLTVDFHSMSAFGSDRQYQVRRIGTASQATLHPKVARSFHDQVTVWLWYWFDDKQQDWIEYGEKGSSDQRSNVDSSVLERAFAADRDGHVDFRVGKHIYKLRFSEMAQKNKDTKSKKYVRRRPQPIY